MNTTGTPEAVQHRPPGRGSPCGVGARLSTVRSAPVREGGVQDIFVPQPCRRSPGCPGVGVGRGGAAGGFPVGGGEMADTGRGQGRCQGQGEIKQQQFLVPECVFDQNKSTDTAVP